MSRNREILAYYLETDASFESWGGAEAGAMHYGFHDGPGMAHLESLARMNEVLAELAQVEPGCRVLDAGCGTGNSALWLARERDARVVGVSLSAAQVEKASRAAKKLDLCDRAEFLERDYAATGLPTAAFDVVWAVESLCHAEDKLPFLREAHRLLRPGGRLIVADYVLEPGMPDEVGRYVLDRWARGWAIAPLWTWERLRDAASRAGFERIQSRDATDSIRPSAEEMFRRGKAGFPDELLTRGKNVRQIAHVEACLHQKVALDMGLWRYRILQARR